MSTLRPGRHPAEPRPTIPTTKGPAMGIETTLLLDHIKATTMKTFLFIHDVNSSRPAWGFIKAPNQAAAVAAIDARWPDYAYIPGTSTIVDISNAYAEELLTRLGAENFPTTFLGHITHTEPPFRAEPVGGPDSGTRYRIIHAEDGRYMAHCLDEADANIITAALIAANPKGLP